ncbi:forespore capture DNA-binding protein RefZ [Bacillus sp. FJAT-45037]|uniref:forespore capture DNA-binding protein RefZ n=1 Tax=Bacillus sp. FJAT-45037 TaxID=2011007 RepID=UPI000C235B69|nr:forespore capture DNA-binding protein RefZ [Bacillus sp. FJAT-45037]
MSEATREKMKEAAARLFYTQGYHGTSVRHIAEQANVNIALVSYYFGGKKGLFEELMTQFLEGYLKAMTIPEQPKRIDVREQLLLVSQSLLYYQQNHYHLARMVHREMTMDSVLVRELMTTYLQKEKHDFEKMVRRGMKEGIFIKQPIDFPLIQLRSMITMPFCSPQYIRELYQLSTTESYFIKRYMEHLTNWIDLCLCGYTPTQTNRVKVRIN